jgi:hypothetical protein
MTHIDGNREQIKPPGNYAHVVEFEVPDTGLGRRLDAMHDHAEMVTGAIGYFTSRRLVKAPSDRTREYVRFHFADARAADVFAELLGGDRITLEAFATIVPR